MAGEGKDRSADKATTVRASPPLAKTLEVDPTPLLEPPPTTSSSPLRHIGSDDYTLGEELGRGGMGQVLLGDDRRLGRQVAIKRMLEAGPELQARFVREMLITARLQHPAIVPVYEAGRWSDGTLAYTMRKVEGRTLRECLRDASLEERLGFLSNLSTAAEAVAYAHTVGVIHRDLKPANLVVGDFGETVVIDWGLARVVEESDEPVSDKTDPVDIDLTSAGARLGTPGYMSPEQERGDAVDEKTDVYALGACLYKLLTGERPPLERDAAIELGDDLPAELSTLCQHAMSVDPGARPTAKQLAQDLRRYQTGALVELHDYSSWELLRRWVRRHRLAAVIALTSAVLLALLVARLVVEVRNTEKALDEVVSKSDALAVTSARALAEVDPLAALHTLSQLGEGAEGWSSARMIASQARHHGLPVAVARLPGARELDWYEGVLIASGGGFAWVVDPASGAPQKRELPEDAVPLDAGHWLGWLGTRAVVFDVVAGTEIVVGRFETRPDHFTSSVDGSVSAVLIDGMLEVSRDDVKRHAIPDVLDASLSLDGERLAVLTGDKRSPRAALLETKTFSVLNIAGPLRDPAIGLYFSPGRDLRVQLANGVNLLWRANGESHAVVCDRSLAAAFNSLMHACVRGGNVVAGPNSSKLSITILSNDVEVVDGRSIVAAASDQAAAFLWDTDSGVFRKLVHPTPALAVALPGKGSLAYTLASDGWIRGWEITGLEGAPLETMPVDAGAVPSLPPILHLRASSPSSPMLTSALVIRDDIQLGAFGRLTAGGLALVIRSLTDQRETAISLPSGKVLSALVLDASGRYLAAATAAAPGEPARDLFIIDVDKRAVVLAKDIADGITALAFAADIPRALVGTSAGRLEGLDIRSGTLELLASGDGAVVAAAAHGATVAVAHANDPRIVLISAEGRTFLSRHRGEVSDLAMAPSGLELVSVARERELVAWNLTTQKGRALAHLVRSPNRLRFSPSGRSVGAFGEDGGTLVDIATGEQRPLLTLALGDIRFSPDEAALWVTNGLFALEVRDNLPREVPALREWVDATLRRAPPSD